MTADPADAAAHSRALSRWYACQGRTLPWRQHRPDPWAIVLSEFLLQQTRVETIVGRYAAILASVPTPAACAALDDRALERLWAGLGYYRRARALRAAAQVIVADHGGRVPDDPATLAALPGFGPYTTGAVMAIAFDRPVPGVDGNIARVAARVLGRRGTPEQLKPAAGDWLQALYEHGRPRALMQAVMDLGATVCTPRAPRCDGCPLRTGCVAAGWPDPAATPATPPRKAKRTEAVIHAWLRRGDEFYLVERPPGLLGRRPAPVVLPGTTAPDTLAADRGRGRLRATAPAYRHTFTHLHWDIVPALYDWPERTPPRWQGAAPHIVPASALSSFGFPQAFARGLNLLEIGKENR